MLSTLVLFLALIGGSAATGSWGYGPTNKLKRVYGPADWGKVSKDCDGRSQSPVNIDTSKVDEDDDDDDEGDHDDDDHDDHLRVHFKEIFGYIKGTLKNNGHSPTLTVKKGAEIQHIVFMEGLVPGLTSGRLDYYSYQGSLTTPGCYQSVSWLVLKEPIEADNSVAVEHLKNTFSKTHLFISLFIDFLEVYGPADWGHVSKDCDGSSQSPVNIDTRKVDEDHDDYDDDDHDDHLRVHFKYLFGYTTGTLKNNGHSPTFTVQIGGATLKNPINGQKYQLAQFHFHFGCDDSVGSEHTVNGKSYPGEVIPYVNYLKNLQMHLVFFNTKYGDISAAATKPDGLTVIGVFLKKGRSVPWGLKRLASKVGKISTEGAEIQNVGIHLAALVPGLASGRLDYYSYQGSLTTPGCYQSVSWLVVKKTMGADERVFENFRKLKAKHGYNHGLMCNNFRPTQPLNGRKIKVHE
ncbi:hypothetical protein QZH41_012118 [Actinostola sp. cb2023]|nr:hypothetical protein QZH41_012118 [Actinostola sp. cb2023]